MTNLYEIIKTQNTTVKQFNEYNSKKKLLSSNVLTQEQSNVIQQLTNTFTFYLHTSNKYMVIVMYYSTTKTYDYLVVNLGNFDVIKCESIKTSKQKILELINTENNNEEKSTKTKK